MARRAKQLNSKANECQATGIASRPGEYFVKSPSGRTYRVDLNRATCTCQWGQRGNSGCSHEMAARKLAAETSEGRKVSFLPGTAADVAKAQHKAARPVCDGIAMVVRDKVDAPKPEPQPKAPRRVQVSFLWDRWTAPDFLEAVSVRTPKINTGSGWRLSKMSYVDLLELDGWTMTTPKLVKGNEVPGWHRWECEMVEAT